MGTARRDRRVRPERRQGGTSILFARDLQCGRKAPYSSEAVAANAAVAIAWAHPDEPEYEGMTAYECPWCGDWHVGHPPPDQEARTARGDRPA